MPSVHMLLSDYEFVYGHISENPFLFLFLFLHSYVLKDEEHNLITTNFHKLTFMQLLSPCNHVNPTLMTRTRRDWNEDNAAEVGEPRAYFNDNIPSIFCAQISTKLYVAWYQKENIYAPRAPSSPFYIHPTIIFLKSLLRNVVTSPASHLRNEPQPSIWPPKRSGPSRDGNGVGKLTASWNTNWRKRLI